MLLPTDQTFVNSGEIEGLLRELADGHDITRHSVRRLLLTARALMAQQHELIREDEKSYYEGAQWMRTRAVEEINLRATRIKSWVGSGDDPHDNILRGCVLVLRQCAEAVRELEP